MCLCGVKAAVLTATPLPKRQLKSAQNWIVAERDTGVENQILVENSRQAYALMCGNLFDNPAKKLKMIGITGTNGKTTSAFLIKDLLQQMGKQVGLMGTVQNMIGSQIIPPNSPRPSHTN